jgi:CTP synthase
MAVERKLDLVWVEAAHLEGGDSDDNDQDGTGAGEKEYAEAWGKMRSAHGVVVPGGFGTR